MSEEFQLILVAMGGVIFGLCASIFKTYCPLAIRQGGPRFWHITLLAASYGLMVFTISWGQLDRYLNEEPLTIRTYVFLVSYIMGMVGLILILRVLKQRKEG